MSDTATISESDILGEVIAADEATLSPEAARSLLKLRFSDAAVARMRELIQRNNAGTLTPDENELLEKYRRVGTLIDLLQAKARLSLKQAGPDG